MKKNLLFSLLALSACFISAANPIELSLKKASNVEVESNKIFRTASVQPSDNGIKIKAADYSSESWTLLGDGKYASQALAGCYGGSTDPVDVVVYEADGKSGLYKVEGVWSDIVENGILYVDATDPDFVVVEKQFTGIVDNVDGNTYIGSLSAEALSYDIDKATFISEYADYNAYVENGVIHFPPYSLGLQWPDAPADSQYGTDPTAWYYSYSKTEGLLILPGGEYVDPWSEVVEGTMEEDIISQLFGMTPSTYSVMIKKNFKTNTYLIMDAWRGFYDQIGGVGVQTPELEIIATDPNNAIVPLASTGINGGDTEGIYNVLSYSYYYDDPADCPEAQRITVTEVDGNTTITFPVKSMILYASTSHSMYYASPGVSTITFKTITDDNTIVSVSDIIDDNDAKVEYFNLQGVRIDNPVAGQLIIKRQGSVVTKEIIR